MENRKDLFKPGAFYKEIIKYDNQYDLACEQSEWIRNQEDEDFVRECVETMWYHKVNFDDYSPISRNWDMFHYLNKHYPIHLVKGKRVLDLGCSDGMASVKLEQSGAEVVAVDIFDKSLNHAKLIKRYFNCDFQIVKADALGDLSHLGKFDILFCSNLIQHISETDSVNPMNKIEWIKKIKEIAPVMIIATNNFKRDDDVNLLKRFGNCELYSKYKAQDGQGIFVMVTKNVTICPSK